MVALCSIGLLFQCARAIAVLTYCSRPNTLKTSLRRLMLWTQLRPRCHTSKQQQPTTCWQTKFPTINSVAGVSNNTSAVSKWPKHTRLVPSAHKLVKNTMGSHHFNVVLRDAMLLANACRAASASSCKWFTANNSHRPPLTPFWRQ